MASALFLSALALGATACQTLPGPFGTAGERPAARPGAGRLDAKGPGAVVWVGDPVDLTGSGYGEHLRLTVTGQVDPAVTARAADPGPAAGKRRVGARITALNFGGRPFDASRARVRAEDTEGRRHPPVTTGTLTTGRPLAWRTLAVGEQRDGWLVFELPDRTRLARLHATLGPHRATWQLRFPPTR
ncbi:hypothetical protein ABT354_18610 [Streptomyces sp. NPDC000594]|uniref:hypothetical protein n=1 Tax=Streptomyces sp. NPDC000594 TaxID=3154261 RepID=UPI00332BF2BA